MAKLIYTAITSLDGYIADAKGNFDWAAPDEEVHRFVNQLERPIGTYLYGRRLYEVMRFWDSEQAVAGQPHHIAQYADIWRAADKIVYSRSLGAVTTERTRLVRDFDTTDVRRMKVAAGSDLSVGGADLAAQALRAGVVDEIRLFLAPVVIGAGTRALPDDVRLDLELLDERRFRGGVVYLRYRITLDT